MLPSLGVSEPISVHWPVALAKNYRGRRPGRLLGAWLEAATPFPPLSHASSARLPLHHLRRSEEHTSELQSRFDLVCRRLLEKKHIVPSKLHESLMVI